MSIDGDINYDAEGATAVAKSDDIQAAVDDARGGDEPPAGKVGFGR